MTRARWYHGKDHDIPGRFCPYCGKQHDAAMRLQTGGLEGGDHEPRPGSVSLCSTCARPAVFTETGIRKPEPDELESIMADPDIKRIIGALHRQQWRPRPPAR